MLPQQQQQQQPLRSVIKYTDTKCSNVSDFERTASLKGITVFKGQVPDGTSVLAPPPSSSSAEAAAAAKEGTTPNNGEEHYESYL